MAELVSLEVAFEEFFELVSPFASRIKLMIFSNLQIITAKITLN